jgi:hypothetical protein
MGKKAFEIPSDKIADYCRRWKITELALFGSALRDDFKPESDIDVLVTFDRDAHWTLGSKEEGSGLNNQQGPVKSLAGFGGKGER